VGAGDREADREAVRLNRGEEVRGEQVAVPDQEEVGLVEAAEGGAGGVQVGGAALSVEVGVVVGDFAEGVGQAA